MTIMVSMSGLDLSFMRDEPSKKKPSDMSDTYESIANAQPKGAKKRIEAEAPAQK